MKELIKTLCIMIAILYASSLFALKKCPKCGRTFPDAFIWCQYCGEKLVKVEKKKPEKKKIVADLKTYTNVLEIRSIPEGCAVYLDNEYKGNTPLTIKNLLIGEYTIRLTFPGYKDFISSVKIEAEPGLVAYWPMDEGYGDIIHDMSGNGNDGTIYGAKWVQGKHGYALEFDGLGSYVEIPNSASLNPKDAITIALWFKIYKLKDFNFAIVKGYDAYELFEIYISANGEVGGEWNFATGREGDLHVTDVTIQPYVWYHVAMTYEIGKWRIYLQGELKKERHITKLLQDTYSRPVIIGAEESKYGGFMRNRFFLGIIDEVRIYNRALSNEEIKLLYESGKR